MLIILFIRPISIRVQWLFPNGPMNDVRFHPFSKMQFAISAKHPHGRPELHDNSFPVASSRGQGAAVQQNPKALYDALRTLMTDKSVVTYQEGNHSEQVVVDQIQFSP